MERDDEWKRRPTSVDVFTMALVSWHAHSSLHVGAVLLLCSTVFGPPLSADSGCSEVASLPLSTVGAGSVGRWEAEVVGRYHN